MIDIETKDCLLINRFLFLSNKYKILYLKSKEKNFSNELIQFYLKNYILNYKALLFTFFQIKEKYKLPDYPIFNFEFNISLSKVCYYKK